jgi:hypothetical protein
MLPLFCQAFEKFFPHPAGWALKVFWNVFELDAFGHSLFFATFVRVVNIAALRALALVHLFGFGHVSSLFVYSNNYDY